MLRILFILNLFCLSAYAESELYNQNEELKTALSQNMYEPNYFSLILGLFLVVGLIYLTGLVYQKLIKVKINDTDEIANKIDIVSTASLGQGKNLHVIKLNGTYSLIGSTAQSITHIKDFSEEDINNFLKEVK